MCIHGNFNMLKNELCKQFNVSFDKLTPVFRENWHLWMIDKINEKQFWDNISNKLGFDYDFEHIQKLMYGFQILNNDVFSLAKQLKNKYPVYILSNHAREFFSDAIKKHNLDKLFDGIFTSYEIKCEKPEKKIYLKFLERFNLDADKCIFIDDLQENIETAKELGFNTILFTSFEQLKHDLSKLGVEVS